MPQLQPPSLILKYLLLTFYYRLLFALVAELCHSIMPQLQPPSLILKYLLLTFYYRLLFALVAELCRSIIPQLQPPSLILKDFLRLSFVFKRPSLTCMSYLAAAATTAVVAIMSYLAATAVVAEHFPGSQLLFIPP